MHKILALTTACLVNLAAIAAPAGLGDASRASASPSALQAVSTEPAAGMLLVARRGLLGPVFRQTVILLLHHDADGSMGLVLNRRIPSTLSDVISGLDDEEAEKHTLFFGGPVGLHQVYMLLRNDGPMPEAQHITADVHFSADRRVLEKMLARKASGDELHLYVGYAGWSAGQLDAEIERGSWELMEGDSSTVFEDSNEMLWQRLIDKLEPIGIEVRFDPREEHLRSRPAIILQDVTV